MRLRSGAGSHPRRGHVRSTMATPRASPCLLLARLRMDGPPACSYVRANEWYLPCVAREPDTCDLLCLDLPKAEAMRNAQPTADRLDRLAQAAKAFGDPTRLAIAIALRDGGEACVCDLGWV